MNYEHRQGQRELNMDGAATYFGRLRIYTPRLGRGCVATTLGVLTGIAYPFWIFELFMGVAMRPVCMGIPLIAGVSIGLGLVFFG